ncbi:DNA topoisomerase IB [Hyphomicrobium sp.]|uniref:DNA topoisomerase IB n=1 Tax=Hyphomicrobium sp. TaxID=82 RepID=UPI002D781D28|nr:DNA topoisomerase IB [Hyphomicrobium sp.]HET6389780.1 DNA topoisomerase IB [Hyphomicrobium sp.]
MLQESKSGDEDRITSVEEAGLTYVNDGDPGIARKKRGSGFSYTLPSGGTVKDARTERRIRSLAIPPAWTDVWICPLPNGHIQATGRDARGRKQYRYHPDWHRTRDEAKFEKILAFAKVLPKLRKTVRRHTRRKRLDREKVLATVVTLLDETLIRVGNEEYARANGSFGLTTLKDRHVTFSSSQAKFRFRGKTGKEWRVAVHDRRIARIVKRCQDLPGQHLFQYEAEDGSVRQITSADVNAYLREVAGEEISAKDFRTWAGTVLAAAALAEFENVDSEAAAKRNVRAAIESVASRLGNTPTICRKCYVHPEILNCYLSGELVRSIARKIENELATRMSELSAAEAATLALLHRRLRSSRRSARRG